MEMEMGGGELAYLANQDLYPTSYLRQQVRIYHTSYLRQQVRIYHTSYLRQQVRIYPTSYLRQQASIYSAAGWSDLPLFAIFEVEHIAVDQVYFKS